MPLRMHFEQELNSLKSSLEEMGFQVEYLLCKLAGAMKKEEIQVISDIIASDSNIISMERNIEAKCLYLITTQQPVARDLRTITAILKVVTDITRIGAHVVDIGELLLRLPNVAMSYYSENLSDMLSASKKMVHESILAFVNQDLELAKKVIVADDEVDDLFNQVKEEIVKTLREESKTPDVCVDILMIAKYFEKIADHAVNISEWGIFKETGNLEETRLL